MVLEGKAERSPVDFSRALLGGNMNSMPLDDLERALGPKPD